MIGIRTRLNRVLNDRDLAQAGVTMVELMVTIFVFSIFLAIVLSSLIGITNTSTQAQVIARSSTGVLIVFQNFDRAIRYADVINAPGSATGGRYVEFRVPAKDAASVATCVQWRYVPGTQVIQSRQWPDGATGSATAWATKLTSVFDDGANYPFVLIPAGGTGAAMQQLTLTIDAGNATQKGALVTTNFVARNSTAASNSAGLVCSAGAMRS
jgi:prepilin-type N-terminal cleavage/methylation domain-containing protein